MTRLKELFEADEIDEIEWYDELYAHWLEELSETEIDDLFSDFTSLVTEVAPSDLEWLEIDVRNNLLTMFSTTLNGSFGELPDLILFLQSVYRKESCIYTITDFSILKIRGWEMFFYSCRRSHTYI